MSDIITTTGRSISTVTAEIVAISNQAAQMAYMSMVEIGKRLVEAKDMVAHGEWGTWLENEVKFSRSTANNFMRIYERSKIEGNSQTFANLGYSQIVQLLTLPDGQLQEFVQTHDVQEMSNRQLKDALAEEKVRREKAEGKADALQQAATKAKTAEEALNKKLERLEKRLSRAEQAESAAQKEAQRLRENPDIPDAMKEQLVAEAKAQAAAETRAELQAQIDAAQAEVMRITEERAAAEKAAQEKTKAEKLENPEAMAFKLLTDNVVGMINQLEGLRLRTASKNPELGGKMREFMRKMAEKLNKYAEGKGNGTE